MTATLDPNHTRLLDFSLTPDQVALVERSERLAREKLAPRAARYDAEATFPFEDYDDLRANRLTALNVPVRFGGLGVSPLTYALILKSIGRANGSTGLSLNMHSTICFFLTRIASEEQQARFFGEVVEGGKLFASIGSEPGTSFRGTLSMEASAEPVAGGYRVSGLKHFCSLSTAASYYWTWATPPGQSFAEGVLYLGIPADSPGIELLPVWDSLGMRATASHSLRFTDVFVEEKNRVGEPGQILSANIVDRFSLGYCAVYLGIAEAAFEFAREYAATRTFAPDPNPISHQTTVQMRTAEMSVQLEAANLLLRRAAQAVDLGDDRERTLALNQAKYFVGEVAIQVTDLALKVVGGRGIMKSYDLERYVRDARSAPIMPPSGDRCLETVGKLEYNLDASMFDLGPGR